MIKKIIAIVLCCTTIIACQKKHTEEIRNDLQKYYDQHDVVGSFVLYDEKNNHTVFYNKELATSHYSPASTFKICNSLVGLETEVIANESFVLKWDSVTRQNPEWNKDQNLEQAFKNSTVWYYQELARRVGKDRMEFWLKRCNYGNADTTGGIDKFWLTGNLRISPEMQIDFLKRFHHYKLPFQKRNIDLVKKIMIKKDTLGYVLRVKTGWGSQDKKDIGWYVGYVETKDNVYYFSNCILTNNIDHPTFANARVAITDSILKVLHVIR